MAFSNKLDYSQEDIFRFNITSLNNLYVSRGKTLVTTSGVKSGCSGWSYFWGYFWMQWTVIFLGLGLDAVDSHMSGVISVCSGWSNFWC